LKDVFTDLEFKTLGKRLLGDDFNVFSKAPEGVQADLFGNAVAPATPAKPKKETPAVVETDLFGNIIETKTVETATEILITEEVSLVAEKNINNTPHTYSAAVSDEEIKKLVVELT